MGQFYGTMIKNGIYDINQVPEKYKVVTLTWLGALKPPLDGNGKEIVS